MSKVQRQLVALLNQLDPAQLAELKIPDIFKPLIKPKAGEL